MAQFTANISLSWNGSSVAYAIDPGTTCLNPSTTAHDGSTQFNIDRHTVSTGDDVKFIFTCTGGNLRFQETPTTTLTAGNFSVGTSGNTAKCKINDLLTTGTNSVSFQFKLQRNDGQSWISFDSPDPIIVNDPRSGPVP